MAAEQEELPVWPTDPVARRAAFRQFVRQYHPDRGGDQRYFAAAVASYRSAEADGSSRTEPDPESADVVFYRQRRWQHTELSRWAVRRVRRKFRPRVR